MTLCEVISPLRVKGKTLTSGEIELSDEDALSLGRLKVVTIKSEAASLAGKEDGQKDGVVGETNGIGEGELIGGFVGDESSEVDHDSSQSGDKKGRKGAK
jgi:hypothetical protein